jgi:ABC-type sugar transport system ATPase subunit
LAAVPGRYMATGGTHRHHGLSTTTDTTPLLRLDNVSKHFGPVQALSDINLELRAGEVTALIGDNGAGKSVTIKTISGIHGPDGGQMYWEGQAVRIRTPRDAAALGIETVFQDLALCDNLDIVQNMFLGRERHYQSVAIAKAVLWNTKLVIMDEPTAALGVAQTAMVLELVRRLADRGHAVMLVSHNMNDVFEVADRIAVLFLGRLVALRPAADMDRQIAVDLMTTGESSRLAPNDAGAESS